MSPTIGADVTEDFKEQIDDAREDGESRSACVRRLLRESLKEDSTRKRLFLPALIGNAAFHAAYLTDGNRGAAAVGLSFMLVLLFWSGWPSTVALANRALVFVRGESREDSESNEVQS